MHKSKRILIAYARDVEVCAIQKFGKRRIVHTRSQLRSLQVMEAVLTVKGRFM